MASSASWIVSFLLFSASIASPHMARRPWQPQDTQAFSSHYQRGGPSLFNTEPPYRAICEHVYRTAMCFVAIRVKLPRMTNQLILPRMTNQLKARYLSCMSAISHSKKHKNTKTTTTTKRKRKLWISKPQSKAIVDSDHVLYFRFHVHDQNLTKEEFLRDLQTYLHDSGTGSPLDLCVFNSTRSEHTLGHMWKHRTIFNVPPPSPPPRTDVFNANLLQHQDSQTGNTVSRFHGVSAVTPHQEFDLVLRQPSQPTAMVQFLFSIVLATTNFSTNITDACTNCLASQTKTSLSSWGIYQLSQIVPDVFELHYFVNLPENTIPSNFSYLLASYIGDGTDVNFQNQTISPLTLCVKSSVPGSSITGALALGRRPEPRHDEVSEPAGQTTPSWIVGAIIGGFALIAIVLMVALVKVSTAKRFDPATYKDQPAPTRIHPDPTEDQEIDIMA